MFCFVLFYLTIFKKPKYIVLVFFHYKTVQHIFLGLFEGEARHGCSGLVGITDGAAARLVEQALSFQCAISLTHGIVVRD